MFTDHPGLHKSPGFIREALWTLEDRGQQENQLQIVCVGSVGGGLEVSTICLKRASGQGHQAVWASWFGGGCGVVVLVWIDMCVSRALVVILVALVSWFATVSLGRCDHVAGV